MWLSALCGVVWIFLLALCFLGSPQVYSMCALAAKLGSPPVARCGRRLTLCLLVLASSRVAAAPLPRGGWQPGEQAAPLALDGPRADAVEVATDVTFLAPGTFDAPLEFLNADGRHGRALLSECVSVWLTNSVPASCVQFKPTASPAARTPHAYFNAPLKCPHADFCASTLVCAVCEHQILLERTPAHFIAPLK